MAIADDTLEELRRLLPQLASEDTIGAAARPFCSAFHDLYRCMRDGLDRQTYQKVLDFLAESAATMEVAMRYLGEHLIQRIEDGLRTSFQGDEWLQLCALRSTFEALRELYDDYLPVNVLLPNEGDLDQRIAAKGEYEAFMDPDVTPANFPETHWWWTLD